MIDTDDQHDAANKHRDWPPGDAASIYDEDGAVRRDFLHEVTAVTG
jgi:hypothetical protein